MHGLNDIKNNLLKQIDSHEFDWMEFHMTDFLHNNGYSQPNDENSQFFISRWPIVVFLLSAFICLSCSTAFHLFYVVNPKF